jgi:hypothetical protein
MEVLLLVWVLGAILCAIVAGAKHRSAVGWGLASALFSPLLTMLALVAVPALPRRGERRGRGAEGECLSCGAPTARGARLCAECRS